MNRTASTDIGKRLLGLGLLELLLVCFFLGGCATQKDVSLLQRQIWTARRDLDKSKAQMAEMEKKLDEKLAAVDSDRQPLRKNQAELGAQLDRIELELGRLGGQMEEASAMYTRNGERISEIQQNQMESMMEIRKNVEDLQRALNMMAGALGMQELAVDYKPSSQTEKQTGEKRTKQIVKTQPAANAQEHYDNALQLFRNGQYDAARDGFESYLQKYPKSSLTDNAQFWLGECYYAQKRYGEAISAYEKTIKEYPKSDKVSSAMLKQGMAFLELGDSTAGKILLKKVVKEYPNSNQAKIARRKLARVK
jgi:tol-pal system protein YbgF